MRPELTSIPTAILSVGIAATILGCSNAPQQRTEAVTPAVSQAPVSAPASQREVREETVVATQRAPTPAPARAPMTAAMTKQSQAALTPKSALKQLQMGNQRFVAGKMINRDLQAQVKVTGQGQYPIATVLSCIDSRSGPEHVFDQGIGDVFAPRIAGNFVNAEILGSMEFASKIAGSKVVVVLGHSSCGAIKGACDNVQLGNLTSVVNAIKPAVKSVPNDGTPRNSKNYKFVEKVAEANVKLTMQNIREKSPILRGMIDRGEVILVGAMLDISTGTVTWY
jgi:carbonic anhydrase